MAVSKAQMSPISLDQIGRAPRGTRFYVAEYLVSADRIVQYEVDAETAFSRASRGEPVSLVPFRERDGFDAEVREWPRGPARSAGPPLSSTRQTIPCPPLRPVPTEMYAVSRAPRPVATKQPAPIPEEPERPRRRELDLEPAGEIRRPPTKAREIEF